MNALRDFLRDMGTEAEREGFAVRCGTTSGHLRNVSYGYRPAAAELCVEIERNSAGAVSCEELRPDLPWSRVRHPEWPHKKGRPVLDFARAA